MIINFSYQSKQYQANLNDALDISIPINDGEKNPNCYWAEPVKFEVIHAENFIGSVAMGGSVNHNKITITPHGNGTHTECYSHITDSGASINQTLNRFHFIALLISVEPESKNNDFVVSLNSIKNLIADQLPDALIIRTLPNAADKKLRQYSGTNPPYVEADSLKWLNEVGVKHLLVDLPSIDREVDGGKLSAHKAFWGLPGNIRKECSITELIYVPDYITDGLYLLNLQICSLESDASPSKPILFKLTEI
jgi:arylformamidase